MIGWEDVYKVVDAMAPLYVALGLGYGSVRWWRIFTKEQCDAINRLVSFITLPLFTFEFTAHADPFSMNYRFIAADAISKVVVILSLVVWAKCSNKGSYCWSITNFSLSTLTNTLVVGVPLLRAMYGPMGEDLVIQASVIQAIIWLTVLLFVLEARRARSDVASASASIASNQPVIEDVEAKTVIGYNDNSDQSMIARDGSYFWSTMKIVWLKLALNPNSYASIIGVVWAFVSNRWHFGMPSIMEGSVQIMSKAGSGMAMFSLGMFMALQEKLVACGVSLTVFSMVLKFLAGPAAMAIGSIVMGLKGDVLRIAIIQAALPQSITSFIYAREYGLHADVLMTAVIFGMMVSLPILIAYYAGLDSLEFIS